MMIVSCKLCGTEQSPTWWKCCPEHTTEQGPDIICDLCATKLHSPHISKELAGILYTWINGTGHRSWCKHVTSMCDCGYTQALSRLREIKESNEK